jgi:hypothetical protein
MPVRISPDDDGFAPLITYEDATHIVVTVEIPKDRCGRTTSSASSSPCSPSPWRNEPVMAEGWRLAR